MNIGDRVKNDETGDIGHVEAMDDDFCDVRLLTPKNEPSCCVTTGWRKNWRPVADDVIPFPRSESWHAEASAFHLAIARAIQDEATP